jgi:uncharacterized protein (DUF111 family)
LKIAYFDCECGAAADMLVGSFLSAGVPIQLLRQEIYKINLPINPIELNAESVSRGLTPCVQFKIKGKDNALLQDRSEELLIKLIEGSSLSDSIKEFCSKVFKKIEAIRKVGEASPNGQLTSIAQSRTQKRREPEPLLTLKTLIEVASFAIAYDSCSIEKTFVSALPLPRSSILFSSGWLTLLKDAGAPISQTPVRSACLDLTGGVILTSIQSGWTRPSLHNLTAFGYGAREHDLNESDASAPDSKASDSSEYPNTCQILIGESLASQTDLANATTAHNTINISVAPSSAERLQSQQIVVLEANIDDMTPQTLAYAMEEIMRHGALDVLTLPAVMKKGRSGHLLQVLCHTEDKSKFQRLLLQETTTLGVRWFNAERVLTERRWQTVEMEDGDLIRIKIALDESGEILNTQPEYEDCASYARKNKLPLKKVIATVMQRFK